MTQQRMNVQAPIERILAERWSTRAFDPQRQVSHEQLATCLEAARWAPSCFGAEPWRYVVADRFTDAAAWQQVVAGLAAKNQLWAKSAPVLIVAVADPLFAHNGSENRWAEYDAGQATICLCLQAEALGLATHQMGGFDPALLKTALGIPDALHLMSVTALGYAGDMALLDESFQAAENAARTRKPLSDIVRSGHWERSFQPPAAAGWEARYQESSVESLPWFHATLDADIRQALEALGLREGAALDLGCGPGTQAVALAKQGFSVTASDVSWTAVETTRKLAAADDVQIACHVDDILNSHLATPFDLIVDRGVFHCFPDDCDQQTYLTTIRRLLKPAGMLLLKCFHKDETSEMGPPGRYDEADIRGLFADGFELVEARESRFGPDDAADAPKALFCIIRRTRETQGSR
ncbi:MAG: nitroreductase [Zetaproteobacteria bacterium CG12_big_fil_rev_8_21_14_0_65_54_13]|nr:MAG: nitroreductase [Zetaproteobacteria bacterium CG23_combo_of_CG06-09_8_20_14_all_54_7]PIW50306.1 MAG: nitroreductase [Zetaproteobacteria bacterium CG12_big_fil_rev_8_21_14_0_65_54_13]PIX53275.1 MAG: nitroreductase [Zetaproteobacteria bacterium CG_4_10_14_3_um_filter_54_28]PJA31008.1 MAG: nitroreductase [Zetaproteobacteria bacterium CG_4_9_14_3_um_filter_54_145]